MYKRYINSIIFIIINFVICNIRKISVIIKYKVSEWKKTLMRNTFILKFQLFKSEILLAMFFQY